jgi:hypothetical protein
MLHKIAGTLRGGRDSDLVFRYGGDESPSSSPAPMPGARRVADSARGRRRPAGR